MHPLAPGHMQSCTSSTASFSPASDRNAVFWISLALKQQSYSRPGLQERSAQILLISENLLASGFEKTISTFRYGRASQIYLHSQVVFFSQKPCLHSLPYKNKTRSKALQAAWAIWSNEDVTVLYLATKLNHHRPVKPSALNQMGLFTNHQ